MADRPWDGAAGWKGDHVSLRRGGGVAAGARVVDIVVGINHLRERVDLARRAGGALASAYNLRDDGGAGVRGGGAEGAAAHATDKTGFLYVTSGGTRGSVSRTWVGGIWLFGRRRRQRWPSRARARYRGGAGAERRRRRRAGARARIAAKLEKASMEGRFPAEREAMEAAIKRKAAGWEAGAAATSGAGGGGVAASAGGGRRCSLASCTGRGRRAAAGSRRRARCAGGGGVGGD